jgi:hypothetical protein
MFERYTERARRVIFFARYEATQFGSTIIQPEHLLIGLIREAPSTIARFAKVPPLSVRHEIEKRLAIHFPKTSVAFDLPLSEECKRTLAYAWEEATALGHRHVGTEHFLLGILREEKTVAAEVLKEAGMSLDAVRQDLQQSVDKRSEEFQAQAHAEAFPPASRDSVRELLEKAPESSLGWLKTVLERLARSPSDAPPSQMGLMGLRSGFSAASGLIRDAEGKITDGRYTSARHEGGAVITETQEFHQGHQISIKQSVSMIEGGKKLAFTHEIVGPKVEQQHRCSIEFDVA